ncbi:hypothetical protein MTO96_043287 [Rhipicephalus appendiculatus]
MLARKSVEEAAPNIVESLASSLRDALLTPGISGELQAMLRELIEFPDAGYTYSWEQHGGQQQHMEWQRPLVRHRPLVRQRPPGPQRPPGRQGTG